MSVQVYDYAFSGITINGVRYQTKTSLLAWCASIKSLGQDDSERYQLALFLESWLDASSTLQLQTSGSTGAPKIVTVNKSAMVASAKRTLRFFDLQLGGVALLALSVRYVAGKMMVVRAMVGGLNLVLDEISLRPLKDSALKVDFLALVPAQVEACLTDDELAFANVKTLIIGGGVISPMLRNKIVACGLNAWETYGMTETLSHIALRKIDAVMLPFQVLDGISIAVDDRGCLTVDAPSIYPHLLVTNDLVELQGVSQFYWLGRIDSVINTGGVKVYPERIEQKLASVLSTNYCVLGLPDERWGQKVVLVIEGASKVEDGFHSFPELNRFEQIKHIFYVSEFPRTATGKIQRQALLSLVSTQSH